MKAALAKVKALPPIAVAIRTQKRYSADGAGYLASAIAYRGFLSVFPMMLLAVSAIGFAVEGDPLLRAEWIGIVGSALPGLQDVFTEALLGASQTKTATGIAGLAGLVWTGSGVVRAAGFALGRVFGFKLYKNFVRNNLWALGSMLGLGALFSVSLVATSFAGGLRADGAFGVGLRVLAFAFGLAMDFALFMVAYRVLTQRQGPTFRKLIPGSILAAIGWSGLRLFGVLTFKHNLSGAQAVYGTFAVTIAVLVTLSIAARLFMYGAELNALFIHGEVEEVKNDVDPVMTANGHRADRSTLGLVREIASDTGTLVRKEVELAKQEIVEGLQTKARAAIALTLGGVAALLAMAFLGSTLVAALDGPMSDWSARLVVTAGFMLLAGAAAAIGVARMKARPIAPEKTVETVKEDVRWARAQLRR